MMQAAEPTPVEAANPTTPTFLAIDDVRKVFGGQVALDGVSLTVPEGEFVTLLGPSGCGKTTLLRLIAGFDRPTTGRILLRGVDIARTPPERRPFNMVFQSYALFPHMNVYDNVAYGLRSAGRREQDVRARVDDALRMVGLEEHGKRPVGELSGGMSQRIALVRAIVNEPAVLLLDEPLGALDLQLRKHMQVELRSIHSRMNTTFIYVTHDQEEALVMSSRVVLMRRGQIVQVGSPEEVYRRPTSRFVAEFVGETSLITCNVRRVRSHMVEAELPGGTVRSFPQYGETGVEAGESGLVAVRPEDLRIVPASSPDSVLQGRLSDGIFVGALAYHVVTLPDGATLRVTADPAGGPDRDSSVGVALVEGRGAFVADEVRSVEPDQ